ncbi:M48 family metallopeptidase [Simplicispira psychrophila]|uniref:M48 family metallopeptidase n=1 Tax=Simplicispira psychrophila TaxID=80882 RepID=UPI000690E855|nr:SprT family zinc-dependent metalloprotease [Simplicispira psychrophila]
MSPLLLHECLAPVEFRHPQANRELLLPGAVVAYVLVRARRRSMGFLVSADGLAVRAPWGATLASVEAALRLKADWIVRKLAQARVRQQRQAQARIDWRDGAVLPYLGAPLHMRLDARQPLTGTLQDADEGRGEPATLRIGLPAHASAAQLRDTVQAWLMRQAQAHFTARLNHFAPLLDVQWRSLRLSSAQTRWGSAKSDGSIRLNWRLLHYRPAIIDYVVAHELSHLREMNHSADFWRTVATVVPDHAMLRRSLRDEPAPCWDD